MRRHWLTALFAAASGALLLGAGLICLRVSHSKAQAQQLLYALESVDVGRSSAADVHILQNRFSAYRDSTQESDGAYTHQFHINNEPLATLRIEPLATLTANVTVLDDKVVSVFVALDRVVGQSSRAAIVVESTRQVGSCKEPYCVGNPIGKPFVVSHLDARASAQEKKRALDLNLSWLTRFRGNPRVCDLSPNAWEDWKAQLPDYVAELQATYDCR